jgi:hypothetical protein
MVKINGLRLSVRWATFCQVLVLITGDWCRVGNFPRGLITQILGLKLKVACPLKFTRFNGKICCVSFFSATQGAKNAVAVGGPISATYRQIG